MPRLALTGGAYQTRSVIASAQRSLNLYAEPMPQQQGEPAPAAHYPTPGLTLLGTLPQANVRGIKQATTGGIYAVAGSGIYLVDPNTWTGTLLGSLLFSHTTPVSMQDNGKSMVIVDGTTNDGWAVDLASHAVTQISDPAFYGADRVDYLDGFLIFNQPGTPGFYFSGNLALTFDPLDFANKQSFSDLLITLAVAKREIWLLGDRTTEVFYNTGAADLTFQEIPGIFIDQGCAAKYSVATYDNSVYWLGNNRAGHGIVLAGGGYQATRISTFAIEETLKEYAQTSIISDAIGMVYALGGHIFYVLTFPSADTTWVYDISTKEWHEWKWIDVNGLEHRHRANCMYNCNGIVVAGDWQNGNLYRVDPANYTDNGTPIKRQRAFPHVLNDGKRLFHREFLADLDTGNPLPPPTVTTTIQQVITWPPQIASMSGFTTYLNTIAVTDWPRGLVYFFGQSSYNKYPLTLATQTAPLASLAIATINPDAAAVDPLSGDLLIQSGTTNGEPILKLDPNTFATIGSFGIATSFPNWPTAVWVGEYLVCVTCNGVSYALLKATVFSGAVSVIRVDNMTQAGFQQEVVSGSVDNRGYMCAGASGGSTATAYLTGAGGSPALTSNPIWAVTITSGAETYDPTSWPTTNPHITSAEIGTIPAAAIDPTWSTLQTKSIGYDHADGNVLLWIVTADSVANKGCIAKVSASSAAVIWTLPVGSRVYVNLEQSRINGTLWVWENVSGTTIGTSWQIDTLLGTATTQPFGGTSYNLPAYPIYDSVNAVALYGGTFTAGNDSPVPVSGTSNFTADWALMGGATDITISHVAADTSHRIFLDWSDDRGHSYGNPVGQSIGLTGEYRKSLQWQRLGYARDRVFRLTWSVPMSTALQGAWINVEPAET